MTVYTLFGQPAIGTAATSDSSSYTLGMQFQASKACGARAVWFYSGTGAVSLPGTIAIFQVTGVGTGTLVHSETATWSGAAASGWVRAAFQNPPVLAATTKYKVCVLNASPGGNWYYGPSHYWDTTGAGASGLTSGILSAPNNANGDGGQCTFFNGASLTYPTNSFNASNYWIDVEVSDIYIVQVASNEALAASVTVTLGQATAAGNTLVVGVASEGSNNGAVTGITLGGSADNFQAIASAGSPLTSAAVVSSWMDPRCAGGQTSVVVTTTAAGSPKVDAYVYEVAGLGPYPMFDQTAGYNSNSATNSTWSITTPATQWPGEICFGFASSYATNMTGPAAPWVTGPQITENTTYLVPSYLLTSATGPVTFAGSLASANYNEQLLVTIAPSQIAYNTGATVAGTGVANPQFTIPNTGGLNGTGVMVGDVMLLDVSFFTEDSTTPTISFSGGGSGDSNGWKLVPMTDGSVNPQASIVGGIYSYVWAYYRVATSADLGATITVTETGSPIGTTWAGVSMAAYTGANQLNPIDRAGGASENNTAQYVVMPTETARIPADWAVYMAGGGFNNGATAVPPAGSVQRQTSMNSGGTGSAIADSNGAVGLNSVGGGHYANNGVGGNCYLSGFTICLAPAGIYVVQQTAASATTISLASGVTAGNTVLVNVVQYGSANPTSSSPTLGGAAVTGTFLAQHTNDTSNCSYDLWVMPNCPNGVTAFACNYSNFINSLYIYEVLGLGPNPVLDQSASMFQPGGTTDQTHETAGPTAATVHGPEIAFAGCAAYTGSLSAFDSAWTSLYGGGPGHGATGYQLLPNAGATPSVTATTNTISTALGLITLAPTQSGGGNTNVNGSVATVTVAALDGVRSVTLPGPVTGVTVAALDKAPGVSFNSSGQVTVAAPYGRATGSNKSTLLMSLLP